MKPLRLEISALGPFAEHVVIDFTQIEGQRLLLIHGPTGSGKTTVLDAMCFGLFGGTSGDEREAKLMRSDKAGLTCPTSVQYDFALGDRSFRVWRQPEQERASRRGSGTTTESHKATLWERTNVLSAEEEGRVLASGPLKVTKAVTELFGFESAQFRQVVVLPQGQFRNLLSAESKDKEKILQRLFQTSAYSRLERALSDKASALRRLFHDDQVRMQTVLEQAEVSTIEELVTRIEGATRSKADRERAVPECKKASEQATITVNNARLAQDKLAELEEAKKAVRALSGMDEQIAEARAKYRAAQSARPLVEIEIAQRAREAEAKSALQRLELASTSLGKARAAKKATEASLEKSKARDGERSAAAEELARLKSMTQSVERLSKAREAVELTTKREGTCQLACEQSSKLVEVETLNLGNLRGAREVASKEAARVEGLSLALRSASALYERHQRFAELKSHAAIAAQKHAILAVERNHLDLQLAQQIEAQEILQRAWQNGQAGALARELEPGKGCPVCGSESHPHPAQAAESLPSEAALGEGRKELRATRERSKAAQTLESDARSLMASAEAALGGLADELGDAAALNADALAQSVVAAELALAGAREASESLASIAESMGLADKKLEAAQRALRSAQEELGQAGVERGAAVGAIGELEEKVPVELRSAGALDMAIAAVASRIELLNTELAKASKAAQLAAEKLASADEKTQGCKLEAEKSAALATSELEDFVQRCLEAGFDTEESYAAARDMVSKLPELERQVSGHEGESKAAAARLSRAKKLALGIEAPRLMELQIAAADAVFKLETAISLESEARKELKDLSNLRRDYEEILGKVSALEKEWHLVASVSDLANGKVPPKISFQRFVLGALLDEVLLAATERLLRMSKGRYSLIRESEGRHKGRAGGLDLGVMDTYTGASRPVETLSGGESFLAALSLSLGLADVVQSYSGGIHLDTLFIDEGFGTLDSNALDLALDTLTELNAEGRLVGIISHVEELKGRIGTRLEVSPGEHGSTTRFVGA